MLPGQGPKVHDGLKADCRLAVQDNDLLREDDLLQDPGPKVPVLEPEFDEIRPRLLSLVGIRVRQAELVPLFVGQALIAARV